MSATKWGQALMGGLSVSNSGMSTAVVPSRYFPHVLIDAHLRESIDLILLRVLMYAEQHAAEDHAVVKNIHHIVSRLGRTPDVIIRDGSKGRTCFAMTSADSEYRYIDIPLTLTAENGGTGTFVGEDNRRYAVNLAMIITHELWHLTMTGRRDELYDILESLYSEINVDDPRFASLVNIRPEAIMEEVNAINFENQMAKEVFNLPVLRKSLHLDTNHSVDEQLMELKKWVDSYPVEGTCANAMPIGFHEDKRLSMMMSANIEQKSSSNALMSLVSNLNQHLSVAGVSEDNQSRIWELILMKVDIDNELGAPSKMNQVQKHLNLAAYPERGQEIQL